MVAAPSIAIWQVHLCLFQLGRSEITLRIEETHANALNHVVSTGASCAMGEDKYVGQYSELVEADALC